jgi:hypothetical protein
VTHGLLMTSREVNPSCLTEPLTASNTCVAVLMRRRNQRLDQVDTVKSGLPSHGTRAARLIHSELPAARFIHLCLSFPVSPFWGNQPDVADMDISHSSSSRPPTPPILSPILSLLPHSYPPFPSPCSPSFPYPIISASPTYI